eukprot:TRINITY_DN1019_c0_g1_i1.p1 TRINITY_DN1019_c0_g1~~TRINITY_DN1019_c0_g1_i1.p1  ORF type:complete len:586 (+),score=136.51 TRINITY_DN1019_c0_g1_i1:1155-2912(+)
MADGAPDLPQQQSLPSPVQQQRPATPRRQPSFSSSHSDATPQLVETSLADLKHAQKAYLELVRGLTKYNLDVRKTAQSSVRIADLTKKLAQYYTDTAWGDAFLQLGGAQRRIGTLFQDYTTITENVLLHEASKCAKAGGDAMQRKVLKMNKVHTRSESELVKREAATKDGTSVAKQMRSDQTRHFVENKRQELLKEIAYIRDRQANEWVILLCTSLMDSQQRFYQDLAGELEAVSKQWKLLLDIKASEDPQVNWSNLSAIEEFAAKEKLALEEEKQERIAMKEQQKVEGSTTPRQHREGPTTPRDQRSHPSSPRTYSSFPSNASADDEDDKRKRRGTIIEKVRVSMNHLKSTTKHFDKPESISKESPTPRPVPEHEPAPPVLTPSPARPTGRLRVRALYDYTAITDAELSFKEGDLITLLEKTDEFWWDGELEGVVGYFPCNYVEQLVSTTLAVPVVSVSDAADADSSSASEKGKEIDGTEPKKEASGGVKEHSDEGSSSSSDSDSQDEEKTVQTKKRRKKANRRKRDAETPSTPTDRSSGGVRLSADVIQMKNNWLQCKDSHGDTYFFNTSNGDSRWECPDEAV